MLYIKKNSYIFKIFLVCRILGRFGDLGIWGSILGVKVRTILYATRLVSRLSHVDDFSHATPLPLRPILVGGEGLGTRLVLPKIPPPPPSPPQIYLVVLCPNGSEPPVLGKQ